MARSVPASSSKPIPPPKRLWLLDPNRAAVPNNLGIVAVDTVVLRILFPIAAVGMALLAEQRGWGLMHALAAPA